MADTPAPSAHTPWHLWVVGTLSVLWNAVGATDFTMTVTKNAAYLKSVPPKELEFVLGAPSWVMVAWGVATWGGALGSLLLLLRRGLAVPVFLVSVIAIILLNLHNYVLSNGREVMGGTGAIVFSGIIFLIGVLLFVYARAMRRRAVLR